MNGTKIAIGIYKIPPIWDKISNSNFLYNFKLKYKDENEISEFKEHENRITNLKDNIYFELFEEVSKFFQCDESHYIFINESLKCNIKIKLRTINVWIIKSHEDLCYFRNADVYFLRGNYLDYYNNFISDKKCITLFYPATSIIYKYYKYNNNNNNIKENNTFKLNEIMVECLNKIEHPFYSKITYAFIHENNEYKNIFKKAKKMILFNKPASNIYCYLNLEREYDFIFIADATQSTKNHELMFHFINYCENNKYILKIIYISDHLILKKNIINFIDNSNLNYVKLLFDNYLSPTNLNEYMNKSKINLIFSGRDAFPRTITESLLAGCYNIALDTLSDGKSIYDNKFGELVGDINGNLILLKNKSISYINNPYLWKQIINIHKKSFDHKEIYLSSKKKFSVYNIISQL